MATRHGDVHSTKMHELNSGGFLIVTAIGLMTMLPFFRNGFSTD